MDDRGDETEWRETPTLDPKIPPPPSSTYEGDVDGPKTTERSPTLRPRTAPRTGLDWPERTSPCNTRRLCSETSHKGWRTSWKTCSWPYCSYTSSKKKCSFSKDDDSLGDGLVCGTLPEGLTDILTSRTPYRDPYPGLNPFGTRENRSNLFYNVLVTFPFVVWPSYYSRLRRRHLR